MSQGSQLCGICICVSVITLLILIISAFAKLEFTEYGLDYSGITKQVAETPYIAGIHFLGVGHHFIKYPKTVISIEFSNQRGATMLPIKSRTSDGLEVILEISFQYRLEFNQLHDLYFTYREEYNHVYANFAIDVLSDNATAYTAYDFFKNREKIGQYMKDSLDAYFKKYCYSTIEFFQLRSVDLPDRFEKTIQTTEVSKQSIHKAEANFNKTLVELETLKKVAEFQAQVTINLAKGNAAQIVYDGEARANSFLVVQGVNADSYSRLKGNMALSNAGLNKFIRTKVIRNHKDDGLTIGVPKYTP